MQRAAMNEQPPQLPDEQVTSAVVNRAKLPSDWPTHKGSREFWEEIGRTVASFGFLEDTLARARFAVAGSRERKEDEIDEIFIQKKWIQSLEVSLYDNLNGLTKRIRKAFMDDGRIPQEVGAEIVERLERLKDWRNALCHGAWTHFAANGCANLRFIRKADDGPEPEMLDGRLSREEIARIRTEVVDLTISLVKVRSHSVFRFQVALGSRERGNGVRTRRWAAYR